MAYISFQPSDYFNTLLYTGNGSTNAVTGVGFQPDFTWIKNRLEGDNHYWCDSVRGATKYIESSTNIAEVTNANGLSSFDADGFTVGTQGSQVNDNTDSYVSWNWKAGTTTGIAGSPSITPTAYSFNQTAGISIIRYVGNGSGGATIPHGLGVKPDICIIKNLGATQNWGVYDSGLVANPWTKYLRINLNGAAGVSTGFWNDTEPTTTLMTLGTEAIVNGSANGHIAYFFANKKGFSRLGAYDGNGNADGPFIYCGFRPGWVLVKHTDGSNNWTMFDTKRDPAGNPSDVALQPNSSGAEYAETDGIDILSNGFKVNESASWINTNTETYFFMAFAEFPFVSSNSIPTVAK